MSARESTSAPQSGHTAGSGSRTSTPNRVIQPRHPPATVSRRSGDAAGRYAPSRRRALNSPPPPDPRPRSSPPPTPARRASAPPRRLQRQFQQLVYPRHVVHLDRATQLLAQLLVDLFLVPPRQDDADQPAAVRRQQLLLDTADPQHLARQRDRTGHRQVAAHHATGQRRHQRRRHRRLVRQQNRRLPGDRPRHRHALLLAPESWLGRCFARCTIATLWRATRTAPVEPAVVDDQVQRQVAGDRLRLSFSGEMFEAGGYDFEQGVAGDRPYLR